MRERYSGACPVQQEANREGRQTVNESVVRELLGVSVRNIKTKADGLRRENGAHKTWRRLAKYFFHGFGFFLLLLALRYAWAFVWSALAHYFQSTPGLLGFVGAFLGLAVLFVMLSLVLGGVNSLVTSRLWFPMTTSPWDMMLQGIALLIPLDVVSVALLYLSEFAFPGVLGTLAVFIPLSLAIGFVCKKVAETWRKDILSTISNNKLCPIQERNVL